MKFFLSVVFSILSTSAFAAGSVKCTGSDFSIEITITKSNEKISINGAEQLVKSWDVRYMPENESGRSPGPMIITAFNSTSGLKLEVPRGGVKKYKTVVEYDGKSYSVDCKRTSQLF